MSVTIYFFLSRYAQQDPYRQVLPIQPRPICICNFFFFSRLDTARVAGEIQVRFDDTTIGNENARLYVARTTHLSRCRSRSKFYFACDVNSLSRILLSSRIFFVISVNYTQRARRRIYDGLISRNATLPPFFSSKQSSSQIILFFLNFEFS